MFLSAEFTAAVVEVAPPPTRQGPSQGSLHSRHGFELGGSAHSTLWDCGLLCIAPPLVFVLGAHNLAQAVLFSVEASSLPGKSV